MAGNAAGKFKSGQLVPLAAKTPVSNVILTIMQTMGYTDTSFGDSTGDVAALIAWRAPQAVLARPIDAGETRVTPPEKVAPELRFRLARAQYWTYAPYPAMTSLPQPLQAVLTLFEGPLADVRFGDVDASELGKLAKEVSQATADLAEHEAKMSSLREELAQRQEALLSLAQRALAYARIYAEGNEALSAQLKDISLPRAGKPRKASKTIGTDAAEPTVAADASAAPDEEAGAGEPAEPEKTKPSYARPKIKRRLGRAAAQGDSA